MASLTSLPRELRDKIYLHCDLALGIEIIAYPTPYETTSKAYQESKKGYPSAALLRTNKTIGDEAREVLFGGNTWRLPLFPLPQHNIFAQKYRSLFRSFSVVFNFRDCLDSHKNAISNAIYGRGFHFFEWGSVFARRRTLVHDPFLRQLQIDWEHKACLIRMHQVHTVILDFKDFCCPSQCCRFQLLMPNGALFDSCLQHHMPPALECWHGEPLPTILVKGLQGWSEGMLMYKKYGFSPAQARI